MNAKTRLNMIRAHEIIPHQVDDQMAAFTVAYEMHADNRRPFYRVYPGIMTALLRLGIEKIDISQIRLPINGLALEFAEGHFLRVNQFEISNLLAAEFDEEVLFIEFVHSDDRDGNKRGSLKFPRHHQSVLDWLETKPPVERDLLTQIMQIVFGVCMIPNSDSDLIKPLVLNRDKEKFESTGDMKYIERARRNGVNGWDVGRDVPTPEEMEILRQQAGEHGRKSPHWRTGYFAIRHTGEGRSVPMIRWIRETFVNKDLWKDVPQGYYGEEVPDE
jgi:hypothetical protein